MEDETDLLTAKEAAAYLRVSPNKIYTLIGEKHLPHVRLGKRIRIPRWGLVNWIAEEAGVPPPPSRPKPFLQH